MQQSKKLYHHWTSSEIGDESHFFWSVGILKIVEICIWTKIASIE
jgi:hypothetical protein